MRRAPDNVPNYQDCTWGCDSTEKKQGRVITAREPPRAPRFEILPETGRGAENERRRGPTLLDLANVEIEFKRILEGL